MKKLVSLTEIGPEFLKSVLNLRYAFWISTTFNILKDINRGNSTPPPKKTVDETLKNNKILYK